MSRNIDIECKYKITPTPKVDRANNLSRMHLQNWPTIFEIPYKSMVKYYSIVGHP